MNGPKITPFSGPRVPSPAPEARSEPVPQAEETAFVVEQGAADANASESLVTPVDLANLHGKPSPAVLRVVIDAADADHKVGAALFALFPDDPCMHESLRAALKEEDPLPLFQKRDLQVGACWAFVGAYADEGTKRELLQAEAGVVLSDRRSWHDGEFAINVKVHQVVLPPDLEAEVESLEAQRAMDRADVWESVAMAAWPRWEGVFADLWKDSMPESARRGEVRADGRSGGWAVPGLAGMHEAFTFEGLQSDLQELSNDPSMTVTETGTLRALPTLLQFKAIVESETKSADQFYADAIREEIEAVKAESRPVPKPLGMRPLGDTGISINPNYDLGAHGKGVYVIPSGAGYSTLGFQTAAKRTEAVAAWLGRPELAKDAHKLGTEEAYKAYQDVMHEGEMHHRRTGQRCEVELVPQLKGLEGNRVEVVDQDGSKRRFWVGRSTGWMPCHLQIHNTRSSGGTQVYGAPFLSVTVVR